MDTFQCNIVHTGKDACINARAVKPPDVGNSYCDMDPVQQVGGELAAAAANPPNVGTGV